MFHQSTTIHHRQQFIFTFGRENRLVHVSKMHEYAVRAGALYESAPMRGLRKGAHYYSYAFGIPPLKTATKYTLSATGQALSAAEWGYYTGLEATKGALQMTAAPTAMVGYSSLVGIKRSLWDLPWATFGAAIKTPIGLAMSPINFGRGLWESATKIPENTRSVVSSLLSFDPSKIFHSTRRAASEVLAPPIVKPMTPILQPLGHMADTALGIPGVKCSTIFHDAPEMMGQGWDRVMAAPANGNSIRLQKQGIRAEMRKKAAEEKAARKEAFWDAVREHRGEGKAEKKAA